MLKLRKHDKAIMIRGGHKKSRCYGQHRNDFYFREETVMKEENKSVKLTAE